MCRLFKCVFGMISVWLAITVPLAAQEGGSVGLGAGSLYSGLGFNFGWLQSQALYYVSAGCTRIGYAVGGGWKGVCGGGVGGVTTAWIPQRGEHHALTLYVGVDRLLDRDANTSARLRNSTHLAAGYYYFFNGLPNDGWNAGIAPVVEISGGTQRGLYMGLGYQFH